MALNSFSNSKDSMEVARVFTKDLLYVSGQKNCMEFGIFCFPTLNWSATLCLLLCSFKCQVHIQSKLYYIFIFLSPLYCIFCLLCNTVRPVSPYLAVT